MALLVAERFSELVAKEPRKWRVPPHRGEHGAAAGKYLELPGISERHDGDNLECKQRHGGVGGVSLFHVTGFAIAIVSTRDI